MAITEETIHFESIPRPDWLSHKFDLERKLRDYQTAAAKVKDEKTKGFYERMVIKFTKELKELGEYDG